MTEQLKIQLDKPMASTSLLDKAPGEAVQVGAESAVVEPVEQQKKAVGQLCEALQDAVRKVNGIGEKMLAAQAEGIAKLSVEIARRVLTERIEEKDYNIESVVAEALKAAPAREGVAVHLNPEDLAEYEKLQEQGPVGVEFVADANVGRAECVVRTGKGVVESVIDQHLERIREALSKS